MAAEVARQNGFILSERLNKEERYAEILGHELSHAVHILTSFERTKMVEEIVEKTNELFLRTRLPWKKDFLPIDLKQKLNRRDALLQELEVQAEAIEEVVWSELKSSQLYRGKSQAWTPK